MPTIDGLDTSVTPPALYLDLYTDSITVRIEAWDNIRTDQVAYLRLDGSEIQSQMIKPADPSGMEPKRGAPPQFRVLIGDYFRAGTSHNVQIHVIDGSENIGISKQLYFDVKKDSLEGKLKIDITAGAGGYNSDHSYLMPANIAVLRGPPNMHLTARSRGAVRFQDVGGAEYCNFYFDENGVSPLVLIRIDNIHIDKASASKPQDEIYITHKGQNEEIISKPVFFDDYHEPTDPDVATAIESVSCNTLGISDGDTLCIVSIIFNKEYIDRTKDETVYIVLSKNLSLEKNTYNKHFPVSVGGPSFPTISIVDYTAEFGVRTSVAGMHTVGFYPSLNSSAYWTNEIKFVPLS